MTTNVLGNIVIVGEAGAGKSSIINMIAGTRLAETSKGATDCIFEAQAYELPVHGRTYRFFDTAGLDEGEWGTVTRPEAIAQLYKLINRRLKGEINLLMLCMRGPRLKDATRQNWKLFHDIICKTEVPTLLVVTGLENETDMNEWWWNNRETFERRGIRPDDTACITAIRGKRLQDGCRAFDEQYEESQAKLPGVILNKVLLCPRLRHVDKTNWFYTATRSIFAWFGPKIREPNLELAQKIAALCGMSKEETNRLWMELNRT